MQKIVFSFCLLFFLVSIPVGGSAEETRGNQGTKQLKNLKNDVKHLKEKLEELQVYIEASGYIENFNSEQVGTEISKPILSLHGFGNIDFQWNDIEKGDSDNQFLLGGLDFFITSRLSERISFLSEIVLESPELSEGEAILDLERLSLRYEFGDHLSLQAGRFHTTLGYWNEFYHHGIWLPVPISRPAILEFEDEGGILPVHLVGLMLNGRLQSNNATWYYTLEFGNGRGPSPDPPQVTSDANDNKAINIALSVEPQQISNLRLGINWYMDKIPERIDNNQLKHGKISENILGIHTVYKAENFSFLAEFFAIYHDGEIDPDADSNGYYAQFEYRIGNITPYIRYDAITTDDADRFFLSTEDQKTYLGGVRWDIGTWVALKGQISRVDMSSEKDKNVIEAQLSFTF